MSKTKKTEMNQTIIKPDNSYLLKFIVIGDSHTGKSSLVTRFADDTFSDSYISTIGIDFKVRIFEANDKIIKLQIWDCAGQERFRSIVSSYYKGAHAVIITYAVSNKKSFENVIHWYEDCKKYCNKDVSIILIGTKSDLDKKREVLFSEGENLAKELGLSFFETSSKYDTNVNEAFINLTNLTIDKNHSNEKHTDKNISLINGSIDKFTNKLTSKSTTESTNKSKYNYMCCY